MGRSALNAGSVIAVAGALVDAAAIIILRHQLWVALAMFAAGMVMVSYGQRLHSRTVR
jgi:hypothetical protein